MSDKREVPFKLEIHSWMGMRREGYWVPEPVATNSRRTFSHIAKAKGWTKSNPTSVIVEKEELVYSYHGYRPKMDGEKQTRKAFFFRGARVWRG